MWPPVGGWFTELISRVVHTIFPNDHQKFLRKRESWSETMNNGRTCIRYISWKNNIATWTISVVFLHGMKWIILEKRYKTTNIESKPFAYEQDQPQNQCWYRSMVALRMEKAYKALCWKSDLLIDNTRKKFHKLFYIMMERWPKVRRWDELKSTIPSYMSLLV